MKTNRSLKDFLVNKHKFQDEKLGLPRTPHIYSILSPKSPGNINLQMMAKDLNLSNSIKEERYLKTTHSHKQLQIASLKHQLTSPKYIPTELKTERTYQDRKEKENDSVQVSHFEMLNKTLSPKDYKLKILGQTNKNVPIQNEPKRPKILNKQRTSLSFYEQFKIGKVLGKGRFGNVFRAQHNGTKLITAVKQISLQKISSKLIQRLVWQIKIQSFLKHEHCLQLYKYYKENNSLYLVVELGDGSLFDKLRQKRYFTEVQTCYYITQTIKALLHMHDNGIIHRDLKPENIVLVNNVVKLADFGWSIYIGKNSKRKTFCGTLDYVSPQIVMGEMYDEMVDVWSVGVLTYELSTGHAPFESSKSRDETYKKILNVDLKFPKYLSEEIKDFIRKLLIREPQNRMSLEEALQHKWIKKYYMK